MTVSASPQRTRIVAENVSVHLPLFNIHSLSLKKSLLRLSTRGRVQTHAKAVVVEALRNVSFTIEDGDWVGLVGINGSGKTTLLRAMAGVYEPTSGEMSVTGSLVAMLVTGLGMYEDADGYHNIRHGGVQLGMSLEEIERKLPDIAAFSGLGECLSLPLYSYSTGMRTRLTFALSTAVEADILLLDEIIGASDLAFMKRANDRFRNFIGKSRIVVIASHNEDWIRAHCNKVMLLHEGRIIEAGPSDQVLAAYHQLVKTLP